MINYKNLTPETWGDFEELFGPRGACGGCWCSLNRRPRKDHETEKGDGNRKFMQDKVFSGEFCGIILYASEKPVGWLSMGLQHQLPGLARSKVMKSPDHLPVYCISCFFITKNFRRMGLSVEILKYASLEAKLRGAPGIEGYPQVPKHEKVTEVFAWTGLVTSFEKAGFTAVSQPSPNRKVMRLIF